MPYHTNNFFFETLRVITYYQQKRFNDTLVL